MHWNLLALPALVAALLGLGTSILVVAVRPELSENRRLALLLVIEAVVIFALHGGQYLLDSAESVSLLAAAGTIGVAAKPSAYLYFLATLDTPLTRPLRTRAAGPLLLLAAVASGALWFVVPEAFVSGIRPAPGGSWEPQPGRLLRPLACMLGIVYLAAVAFTLSAWRRARTEVRRSRMRAYAIAFITRDALFLFWAVAFLIVPIDAASWRTVFISIAFMPWIYIPLVGYGMLNSHLFDFDLHLGAALRHGLLAAPFAAAFFVTSELLEQVVSFDSMWLGLAAAAGVALLLQPLRRMTRIVTGRLMPNIDDAGYRDHRAREIYRALYETFLADAELQPHEARVLARVRHRLGLTEDAVRSVEGEVLRGIAAAGPEPNRLRMTPTRM